MVPRPRIVGRGLEQHRPAARVGTHRNTRLPQLRLRRGGVARYDQQVAARSHGTRYGQKTVVRLIQIWSPVGSGMGPRQLHEALRFPFGRKPTSCISGNVHICMFMPLKVRILSLPRKSAGKSRAVLPTAARNTNVTDVKFHHYTCDIFP